MENKKTVLIIDDDFHIKRILEFKVKKGGYHVLTATNGEQGLEIIKDQKPDALITDLNMPGIDGQELCFLVNPIKKERPFLTIIVTGRINPDEQQWIDKIEDVMFMEKPFSPSKILDCLDHYFEKKER